MVHACPEFGVCVCCSMGARRACTYDRAVLKDALTTWPCRYTCPRARMLYWRKALTEYKKLFPDMDAAIEKKWWPSVKLKLQRAAQLQQQAAAAAQTQSLSLADMHPETG